MSSPYFILASLSTPGTPFAEIAPSTDIWLPTVSNAIGLLTGPEIPPGIPSTLGNGYLVSVVLPPVIAGQELGLQGFATSTTAANGFYASTAHILVALL